MINKPVKALIPSVLITVCPTLESLRVTSQICKIENCAPGGSHIQACQPPTTRPYRLHLVIDILTEGSTTDVISEQFE
ncbi:hypothetical protein KKK_11390 [Pseudomonas putida B6-2]|nr:hypothetical protein KKK_11390 [Pseudomonas putida B6-2]